MKHLLAILFFLLFVVPASAQTCPTRPPGDNSNSCASTAFVHAATGGTIPITVPNGGTGQTSFTSNLPLIGNGAGAIGQGTRSGNTTGFLTFSGTLTNGDCPTFNSGNIIDSGAPCSTGTGSGTVAAGLTNQLAYYAANGTTVTGTFNINFLTTGNWYQPLGENVQRLNDQLLLGGATLNDMVNHVGTGGTGDWLSTFEIAAGLAGGATQFAALASLTGTNASNSAGILGAGQSLHVTSSGASSFGVEAYAVNNNASLQTSAWGVYSECHRTNSTVGQCNAFEAEVRNLGNDNPADPYTIIGGQPANADLTSSNSAGCGAGLVSAPGNPCTTAYLIFANPSTFDSGIIFANGSLTNVGGTIRMIQAPINYAISWYTAANTPIASIVGDVGQNLDFFANGTLKINGSSGVSCSSGITATTFRSVDGLVTHC